MRLKLAPPVRERTIALATTLSLFSLPAAGAQDLARTHLQRAGSCYDAGDYACALAHADSTIAADPAGPTPFVVRGLSRAAGVMIAGPPRPGYRFGDAGKPYFARNLTPSAQHTLALSIQDFGAAIARDSSFAEAYYHRGYVRALLGRLPEAIADFGRAATMRSSVHRFAYSSDQLPAIAYNDRGLANEDRGAVDSAVVDFSHAIALAPNYPLARYNRARLLMKQGKHEAAAADFQQVLTLTDDSALAAAVHSYLRQLRP